MNEPRKVCSSPQSEDNRSMYMKTRNLVWITIIIMLSLGLGGCNAAPAGSVESAPVSADIAAVISTDATETLSELLPSDYDDALSARNQLALGTLRIDTTADAVTPDQARTLALLWQGYRSLSALSTTAGEEIAALQQEILTALTADQIHAIRQLRLTSSDLNAFYEERGIPLPAVNPDGMSGTQRGRDMSEEERAAWRAEREALGITGGGGGGGGGAGAARRDALIDAVISLLVERME